MSDIEQLQDEGSAKGAAGVGREGGGATREAQDRVLRKELLALLRGGNAHRDLEAVTARLPPELRGARPPGQPFTPWRLLEHMRISLRDILDFIRDPEYISPPWPAGYWPPEDAPPAASAWAESLAALETDLRALEQLVEDPASELGAPIPHGTGQTMLREVLVAADHLAYHLGQFVLLRRLLGAWPEEP
jgi:uncharacterized damage-inducible protein DinB